MYKIYTVLAAILYILFIASCENPNQSTENIPIVQSQIETRNISGVRSQGKTQNIAGGGSYTLVIKSDGTLHAWGDNTHGELGLDDTNNRTSPTQIGKDTDWHSVTAGVYGHTVSLKTDGTLHAWGYNEDGKLGLGDTNNRMSPTQIDIQ